MPNAIAGGDVAPCRRGRRSGKLKPQQRGNNHQDEEACDDQLRIHRADHRQQRQHRGPGRQDQHRDRANGANSVTDSIAHHARRDAMNNRRDIGHAHGRPLQWRRPAIPAMKPMPAAIARVNKGRWPTSSSSHCRASPPSGGYAASVAAVAPLLGRGPRRRWPFAQTPRRRQPTFALVIAGPIDGLGGALTGHLRLRRPTRVSRSLIRRLISRSISTMSSDGSACGPWYSISPFSRRPRTGPSNAARTTTSSSKVPSRRIRRALKRDGRSPPKLAAPDHTGRARGEGNRDRSAQQDDRNNWFLGGAEKARPAGP